MSTIITTICAGWVDKDGEKHECGVVICTTESEEDVEYTTSHGMCEDCFKAQIQDLNER